jgi:hypothetical protein
VELERDYGKCRRTEEGGWVLEEADGRGSPTAPAELLSTEEAKEQAPSPGRVRACLLFIFFVALGVSRGGHPSFCSCALLASYARLVRPSAHALLCVD